MNNFKTWKRRGIGAITLLVSCTFVVAPIAPVFAQDASNTTNASPPSLDANAPSVAPPTSDTSTSAAESSNDQSSPPQEGLIPGLTFDLNASNADTGQSTTPGVAPPPADNSQTPISADAQDTQSPVPDTTSETNQTSASVPQSTQTLSSMATFGTGEPTVNNPSVFTFQNAAPKVNGQSGALTQRLQLDIPPGRNGVQPDLALEYNNQNTDDGVVGYGWTVSIPSIQRLNKTGSQNLYGNSPSFTSSTDGELASISTSTTTPNLYRARVDDGSFNSYSFANNTWTVYDKKGTRYLYGATDQGRQFAAGNSSNVYKWMLEEIRDTNDNFVRYVYTKDNNEIYPSQIIYTGHGSTDGIFTINFTTASRPDTHITYRPSFKVTTNYRISEIDASVNGTPVRKYFLSYGSGNNGLRSLLTGVQEKGYDDNNAETVFPAMTFGYVSTSTMFYTPGGVNSAGFVVADTNGSGINDVNLFYLYPYTGTYIANMKIDQTSDPLGVVPPEYWAGGSDSHPPNEHGVRYLDVNADGKADITRGETGSDNVTLLYLNAYTPSGGYAWNATTTFVGVIPRFAFVSPSGGVTTGLFGDVNGDGLPDFAQSVNVSLMNVVTGSFLGNGSAWDDATTTIFYPPEQLPVNYPTVTNSQLVDINGDGLDDWVYSDDYSHTYVLLNTGTGWESSPDQRWTIGSSTLYHSTSPGDMYYDRGMRFFDINGDGLPDFVRAYTMPTYSGGTAPDIEVGTYTLVLLNTGSGWATSTAYTLPTYIMAGSTESNQWHGTISHDEYGNWNGNGQQNQDVLSTITYPRGGSVNITYTPSAKLGTNPSLPISLLVVTRLITNDGMGNSATTSYSYGNGQMYLAQGPRERKFAGFATSTATLPNSKVTTYFDQGDASSTSLGEQSDGYGQINHPFREDVFDLNNTLQQRTFYRWDTFPHGSSTAVLLGRQLTELFNADGSHIDKAVDYGYSTTTNDLLQTDQYGQVTGGSDGTFSDTSTDKRTTIYRYAASSTIDLSLPIEQKLLDYNSATTTDEKIYYDGLGFGSVSSGNPTRQEDWIAGSQYASSTKSYNSYGLVTSQTDRRGKPTAYVYDAYNLYPATSTNPLSQSTQYTYNYSNGKVKLITDPNGNKSSNTYDGLGRVTAVSQSDITVPSTLVTKTTSTYADNTSPPSSVHQSDYLNSATTTDSYRYLDGLDRLIQTRSSSESAGTFIVQDTLYNPQGLTAAESLPYFASGSGNTSATSTTALFSTYSYDALQRVIALLTSVGTTTYGYANWFTTVTDPNIHSKIFYKDAFGSLNRVDEINVPSTYTTLYSYDAANNLSGITDANGNVRSFSYDGLGNRTSAQDLHASGDGTFGVWSYTFDDSGNMTSSADPKGQNVLYAYDDLNRALTEDYTGAAGTEVTYSYDSCTNGIGHLCVASSTESQSTFSYNPLGLYSSATSTINGQAFHTGYDYDRQGNVTTLQNADNSQVQYTYNPAGLIFAINKKDPAASTWSSVSTSTNYSPMGKVGLFAFANGASTTNTYDANKLYRLISKKTCVVQCGITATSTSTTTLTFTSSDTWTVPAGVTSATVEVYGAGGGGGLGGYTNSPVHIHGSGGGGGGGAYAKKTIAVTSGNTYTVRVGGLLTGDSWFISSSTVLAKGGGDGGNAGAASAGTGGVGGSSANSIGDVVNAGGAGAAGTGIASGSLGGGGGGVAGSGAAGGAASGSTGGTGSGPSGNTGNGGNGQSGSGIAGSPYGGGGAGASASGLQNGASGSAGAVLITFAATTVTNSTLQDLSYTYDAVGNMKTQTDNAPGGLGHTVTYSYDGLDRLTDAATIGAGTGINDIPVAYWKLDESSGNATDATGNGYTMTNNNSASFAPAKINNGGDFGTSNTSKYFSTASNVGIGIGSHVTLSVWVKLRTELGSGAYYFISTDDSTSMVHHLIIYEYSGGNRYLTFSYFRDGVGSAAVSYTVNLGTSSWYHLVYTYDGTTLTAYVNGTSVGSTSVSGTGSYGAPSETDIGSGQGGGGYPSAYIDEVGIWNTALSPSEITVLYNGGAGLAYPFVASSSPYATQSFGYDALGNLTSKTGAGTYAYAGTGYANPDAVTSIGNGLATSTYSYDNNGNLTSVGTSTTYAYDYKNRLIQSVTAGATSTYAYDFTGGRVRKTVASTTTFYPSKLYSLTSFTNGATTTATAKDSIFAGDALVSTVNQILVNGTATGTPFTYYDHPDHLGSTNVVSNASGGVTQALDYYPYGSERVSTGIDVSQREYIGEIFDESSQLSYLNARYYNGTQGQFLSQDPTFWSGRQNLADPQSMNSYSYANDNPIDRSDPSGLLSKESPKNIVRNILASAFKLASSIASYVNSITQNPSQSIQNARSTVDAIASNPGGFVRSVGTGMVQDAKKNVSDIFSGDDERQEQGIANSILFLGSLATPEGRAARAVAVATKTDEAVKVFRVFGGRAPALGESWTPVNPSSVSDFRAAAGLRDGNSGRFVIEATVNPSDVSEIRPALPMGDNPGGLLEYVIKDPSRIDITNVSGANPAF